QTGPRMGPAPSVRPLITSWHAWLSEAPSGWAGLTFSCWMDRIPTELGVVNEPLKLPGNGVGAGMGPPNRNETPALRSRLTTCPFDVVKAPGFVAGTIGEKLKAAS